MLNREPNKQDILDAHRKIRSYVHHTPIFSSRLINVMLECKIYYKCENFQRVGAFKIRGVSNALLSLDYKTLLKGVATHSSGNHAAALSFAASMRGIPAYIVMPRTASQVKKNAVKEYRGKIIECEPTLQSREETLEKVTGETGAYLIHPYDNYSIIAGQATAAKEMFEEVTDLDYIITPVGGGGLLSGTCLSTKYFSPSTKVIGAEPKGADDAYKSMRDGVICPSVNPNTICDGLLAQLSEKTFSIIKNNVYKIITVEESSIIKAMRLIWERMKIIVEPSAAVALAVVLEHKRMFVRKRIGIVLTGGNVDLERLPWMQ